MTIADTGFGDGDPATASDSAKYSGRPYGWIGLIVSCVLTLVATVGLFFILIAVGIAVLAIIRGWQGAREALVALQAAAESDRDFLQQAGVVVSLVFYAILSVMILIAARIRGGSGWRGIIAWRPWHPFRGARLFWILVPATIVYSFGADALIAHYYPPSKDWITLPHGALWVGLFVLLAVVFAPITEELLFRGWIFTSLRRSAGFWVALLVSSVLFAVAHWEKSHLYALAVLPVGLMLGFLRERTGSIKASMAFHALYNGAASVLLVFSS